MAAQPAFIHSLLTAAFAGGTYTGGTITIGLFKTGLPSTTGVEITSATYARQTLTFSPPASKQITTSANAKFTNLPTGSANTVVAYGIYSGTTLIDEKALTTPFTGDATNNELEIQYTFSLAGT